jgi:hypothetical protein
LGSLYESSDRPRTGIGELEFVVIHAEIQVVGDWWSNQCKVALLSFGRPSELCGAPKDMMINAQ